MNGVNVKCVRTHRRADGGWHCANRLTVQPALKREVIERELVQWRSELARMEDLYRGHLTDAGRYYPEALEAVASRQAVLESLPAGELTDGGPIVAEGSPPIFGRETGKWLARARAVGLLRGMP